MILTKNCMKLNFHKFIIIYVEIKKMQSRLHLSCHNENIFLYTNRHITSSSMLVVMLLIEIKLKPIPRLPVSIHLFL